MSGVVLLSTSEFALKSQPVRHQLMRLLKRHLRFNLKRMGLEGCETKLAGGFLVVYGVKDAENTAKGLARTLGVAHADPCERVVSHLDEIVECTVALAEKAMKKGETFAVRARNFEPSPLKGKEIEIRGGAEVLSRLQGTVKVNLASPDHTFRVFFGAEHAFISGARFDGPGGLPVGSQGTVLGLATDSAYSPLAFYLLMKRGAMVWPVIPDTRLLLGEIRPSAIIEGLKMLAPYVPKKKFQAQLIEIDEEASKVLDNVDPHFQRVFSVRLVFRAIAHLVQTGRALGLVTGDLFGRDGLETLNDLRAVDEMAEFPVYRPLLTLDEKSVNQGLQELGLLRLRSSQSGPHIRSVGLDEDSIKSLRDLEERVKADQLAQRLAASSTRVPI